MANSALRKSLIIILSILPVVAILVGIVILANQNILKVEPQNYPMTLYLIILCGSIGGILSAIKSRNLYYPSIKQDGAISLGFIADAAFGGAGGILIFLITPGSFDPQKQWELTKIIGIALVGGYAGRILIDAMAQKTMTEEFGKNLEDGFDTLNAKTEERTFRILSAFKSDLALEDYLLEMRRIVDKEIEKEQGLCLIYSDIEDLKKHLRGKPNAELGKMQILEMLSEALEEGANNKDKPFDIYSLSYGDPDRIMIARESTIAEAEEIADKAGQDLKAASLNIPYLAGPGFKGLSVRFVLIGIDSKLSEAKAEGIHKSAVRSLDDLKKETLGEGGIKSFANVDQLPGNG